MKRKKEIQMQTKDIQMDLKRLQLMHKQEKC